MNANPRMCEACGTDPATSTYPIGGGGIAHVCSACLAWNEARDAEEADGERESESECESSGVRP